MPAPRFCLFSSYYVLINTSLQLHVEGLVPANLCLVMLLSSTRCSQFARFRLQHITIVNKTSSFKTKLIGNNAGVSRINPTDA